MDNLKKGRLRDIYVPLIVFSLVLAGVVIAAQVGPKNLFVAITTGNTAPIVYYNGSVLNGTVTLIDGGLAVFSVRFNVSDADGTGNINNAAVGVNITFNGLRRANNSGNCADLGDSSSTISLYICNVTFSYFDNASAIWEINLSAADNAGAVAYNDSDPSRGGSAANNLSVSSLSAFTLQTTSVVTSASLGDVNKELSIVVNNTGNFDFTILNVTPVDLNASLTDFFRLNGNFSINATASSGGLGKNILNNTPTNFTDSLSAVANISATLPHKITSGEADKLSNRTLYIYIDVPSDKGLSSGVTYNVTSPWQLFAS